VNDAPSLKAAHIGIAMGGRGSDVAREAAALVLLDDDFGSIVQAIRLGRRIYDNLRKAVTFIFAVHVPIAGLALLPIILGWPLIFAPVHIALLELIIDPVCSIVFEVEVEESGIMKRRPRDPETPLFSTGLIWCGLLQGLCVLILTSAVFAETVAAKMPDEEIRAVVFLSLIAGNFALILVNRSFSTSVIAALKRPNPAFWIVFAATTVLLGLTLTVAPIRHVFSFAEMNPIDFAWVLGVGVVAVGLLELFKLVLNRSHMVVDLVSSRVWHATARHARRIVILVMGSTLILFGIVMLVTPGPGWLAIFGGLGILGLEFVWARRLLQKLKAAGHEVRRNVFGPSREG